LAKYGIGVLAFTIPLMAVNLLDAPRETNGDQAYWGQKLSGFLGTQAFLMFDMGQLGVRGGQFQVSGQFTISSWDPYLPDTLSLNRLAYHQTFFDDTLEFLVGYTTLDTAFVGAFIGGNIANPFGPSATIPVELGLATPPAVAPAAWIKLNLDPGIYGQFAIQRSLPPVAPFITNDQLNPSGFEITVDDAEILLVGEAGYKRGATPGAASLWGRLGGMYNSSPYPDFSEPEQTTTNFAGYLLVDGQVVQLDASSPLTAYRGLYLGGSVMYAPPNANVISQYYEARAYVNGPFRSRFKDQISLVYFHQVFSLYLRDSTNAVSDTTRVFARSSSNTMTASYTGNILPGLYATLALSYTDHPSFVFDEAGGHALLFVANLFIAY
jgi:porin